MAEETLDGRDDRSDPTAETRAQRDPTGPPTVDPWLDVVVGGNYRLEERIGRGGMSVVYRATDLSLDRSVAVKLILPEEAANRDYLVRFNAEARAASRVEHPNIVPIYAFGDHHGAPFLVMRYINGSDLRGYLAERGPLGLAETLSVLDQVAGALDAIHAAGLTHRDVKPANILIAAHPGSTAPVAYLTDFGIAKLDVPITATGQVVGTAAYAAPEQLQSRPVDARTDEYALTCVLFECVTGRRPYDTDDMVAAITAHLTAPAPRPTDLRPDLPAGLDELVGHGMAKDPELRYPSCSSLMTAARTLVPTAPLGTGLSASTASAGLLPPGSDTVISDPGRLGRGPGPTSATAALPPESHPTVPLTEAGGEAAGPASPAAAADPGLVPGPPDPAERPIHRRPAVLAVAVLAAVAVIAGAVGLVARSRSSTDATESVSAEPRTTAVAPDSGDPVHVAPLALRDGEMPVVLVRTDRYVNVISRAAGAAFLTAVDTSTNTAGRSVSIDLPQYTNFPTAISVDNRLWSVGITENTSGKQMDLHRYNEKGNDGTWVLAPSGSTGSVRSSGSFGPPGSTGFSFPPFTAGDGSLYVGSDNELLLYPLPSDTPSSPVALQPRTVPLPNRVGGANAQSVLFRNGEVWVNWLDDKGSHVSVYNAGQAAWRDYGLAGLTAATEGAGSPTQPYAGLFKFLPDTRPNLCMVKPQYPQSTPAGSAATQVVSNWTDAWCTDGASGQWVPVTTGSTQAGGLPTPADTVGLTPAAERLVFVKGGFDATRALIDRSTSPRPARRALLLSAAQMGSEVDRRDINLPAADDGIVNAAAVKNLQLVPLGVSTDNGLVWLYDPLSSSLAAYALGAG